MSASNSVPDICEFAARVESTNDGTRNVLCLVELRLHRGEIPLGSEECEVAFRKITVTVDLEGMEIVSGTRGMENQRNQTQYH